MNITNLLNKDWGKVYFVPNTFNSTASVGLTKVGNVSGNVPEAGDPTYNFKTPGTPYTIDQFASRFGTVRNQIQLLSFRIIFHFILQRKSLQQIIVGIFSSKY